MGNCGQFDRFVNVRGLRVHYLDCGGDGEIVVALHGLFQTAHAFDVIVPLFVPHCRLIAVDIRGRGDSEWDPERRYRMDHYFRDLRSFLAELGLERVSLMGSSLGGWIAMMFATAYPDRVERLVLNDCGVGGDPGGVLRVANHSLSAPETFETFDAAVAWFVDARPWLINVDAAALRHWVEPNLRSAGDGRWTLKCDPAAIRMAYDIAARISAVDSVENDLAWQQALRLTMPVLLLRGELSDVISHGSMVRLKGALPRATFVQIPGVGHAPTLIEPAAQDALRTFFGLPG